MKGIWAYLWSINNFVMMIKIGPTYWKNRKSEPRRWALSVVSWQEGSVLAVCPCQICRSGSWAPCLLLGLWLHEISIKGEKYCKTLYREHVRSQTRGFLFGLWFWLLGKYWPSSPFLWVSGTAVWEQDAADRPLSALVKTRRDHASEERGRDLCAECSIMHLLVLVSSEIWFGVLRTHSAYSLLWKMGGGDCPRLPV